MNKIFNVDRVAIIVQRCHESVVGGSESEAFHYANLLKDRFEVHILTTTAVDPVKWRNTLAESEELNNGIVIKRFSVTQGRATYWHKIYERLIKEYSTIAKEANLDSSKKLIKWPIPLQEELIYKQGPYSTNLMDYLNTHWDDYKAIIFFTYLYPTTYFGMFNVPKDKVMLVPTLHDEPPAYLTVYKYMARRSKIILWNTKSERRFGELLWGEVPGCVIGIGINTKEYSPLDCKLPYLLYCGRIDVNKGCNQLVEYFLKFKEENPGNLRLVFTGTDYIGLPLDDDIEFKGFVSEEEKLRLISGALIFVMPSFYESFSIVTLEAMAQRTPVLGNAKCEVVTEHIKESNAGMLYYDYKSFADSIKLVLENKKVVAEMGERGRNYVVSNYNIERIKKLLIEKVEKF